MPRTNYDTLHWALITTFQGLLGDQWYEIMYIAMKAVGWQYVFYHSSLFLLGKILLNSLFVAVLLSLFRVEKVIKPGEHKAALFRKKTAIPAQFKAAFRKANRVVPIEGPSTPSHSQQLPSISDRKPMEESARPLEVKPRDMREVIARRNRELKLEKTKEEEKEMSKETEKDETGSAKGVPIRTTDQPAMPTNQVASQPDSTLGNSTGVDTRVAMIKDMIAASASTPVTSDRPIHGLERINETNSSMDSDVERGVMTSIWHYAKHSSLFIFHRLWCFRIWLAEWVVPLDEGLYYLNSDYLEDVEFVDQSPMSPTRSVRPKPESGKSSYFLKRKRRATIFESVILVLILLSILTLIIDNPLKDPDSGLKIFCGSANTFFTCVFAAEAILKIIAMGFFSSANKEVTPYIMSGWNVLDFFVVVTSLINVFNFSDVQIFKTFKAIRALRILRPMRVLKNEQLKLLVNTISAVIPSLIYLVIITFFYVFSIGIIATFCFKGRVYTCSITGGSIQTRSVTSCSHLI